ncbi:hypothetical protein [Mesorhizobium sp. INR15]|uniref:hypothetical protein n=1 Tax=Mesorhizobium sp. INR15 TaxID=2654248 RepID=UPI0035BC4DD7
MRHQAANDLGGVFFLSDLLMCRVEDERQFDASSFECFAVMLDIASTVTAGDHFGSDQTFSIKDGLHTQTP